MEMLFSILQDLLAAFFISFVVIAVVFFILAPHFRSPQSDENGAPLAVNSQALIWSAVISSYMISLLIWLVVIKPGHLAFLIGV